MSLGVSQYLGMSTLNDCLLFFSSSQFRLNIFIIIYSAFPISILFLLLECCKVNLLNDL